MFSTAIKPLKPNRTQTNARSKNRQPKLLLLSATDEKNQNFLTVFITKEEDDEEETKNNFILSPLYREVLTHTTNTTKTLSHRTP